MPRKKKAGNVEPKKKRVAGSPKDNQTKEDVVEYFEVEKDGKDKIVEAKGKEIIEQKPNKNQITNENKLLRNILIALGILVLIFLATYFLINSSKSFEFKGVGYTIVDEITPYKTSFPVKYQGGNAVYSIYLRNDPRKLGENIPFYGKINLKQNLVINATNNLNCGGDGIIAVANLAKMQVFQMEILKDKNATCDSEGRYMFVNIAEGNESKVKQYGPSCYELAVNNCEVIPVTERFLIEVFADVKEKIDY